MFIRKLYYILRIILLSFSVLSILYYFLVDRARADILGFGEVLEITVVPVLGVPEFDYFFNMILWFFLIGMVFHILCRIALRS